VSLEDLEPEVFQGWLDTSMSFFNSNRISLPGTATAVETIKLYVELSKGNIDNAKLNSLYSRFNQALAKEFSAKGEYEKKLFKKLRNHVNIAIQNNLQETYDFFNSSVRLEVGQQRRNSSHMVETLKLLVLREPTPKLEDEFIGLSYAYASQISGVFRYALQDCYAWEKLANKKTIDPYKVSNMEVEDLFDYYNKKSDLLYFEGYDSIVRNSVAHSNFQYDTESEKITYINETKKEEPSKTGISGGTKETVEYSYEQLRQMYAKISSIYSLVMIVNQSLMVGTCAHFLSK